jgi:hypothetical protein
VAFARAALGDEVSIDPLEAMLRSVRLAAGTVAYYRRQLFEIEGEPPPTLIQGFRKAVWDLSRFSTIALKAGVEEQRAALTDEAADLIARAINRAAAPLELSRDERAAFGRRVGEELKALEAPRREVT